MPVPLEVSIARLIGDPAYLKEQPEVYPKATLGWLVRLFNNSKILQPVLHCFARNLELVGHSFNENMYLDSILTCLSFVCVNNCLSLINNE